MPSAPPSISKIRKLISNTPVEVKSDQDPLLEASHHLRSKLKEIIKDASLLDEVLKVAEEIDAFRGRGNQYASKEMTRFFGAAINQIIRELPEIETPFSSFSAARSEAPSQDPLWDALEKLSVRAIGKIRGPRSRSQHTSTLKAEAWDQLGQIAELVRDATHLELALECAADGHSLSDERQSAIAFLVEYWGGDDPNQETAELLWSLEKCAPGRSFLVTVMQAQIDLGLNDEFGALIAVEDWDEKK
jgi:hypothetical protein